jgi:hypothetical protein
MLPMRAFSVERFACFLRLISMDQEKEKREIERRLARCRELMTGFPDGVTAQNLREIERDLLERLEKLRPPS